jgi:hypothetical protein
LLLHRPGVCPRAKTEPRSAKRETGLEPATSGVTGATGKTMMAARFRCLMGNESRRGPSTSAPEIGAVCGRFTGVWAAVPNGPVAA